MLDNVFKIISGVFDTLLGNPFVAFAICLSLSAVVAKSLFGMFRTFDKFDNSDKTDNNTSVFLNGDEMK